MVPLLPLLLGVPVKVAVATSLLVVLLVTAMNVRKFHKAGQVRFDVGLRFGVMLAVGASIAQFLSVGLSDAMVRGILATVLMILAFWLAYSAKNPVSKSQFKADSPIVLLLGIGVGLINGFTGIGGGIIVGPLLILFAMVKNEEVVPTTNLVMMCSAISAVISNIGAYQVVSLQQLGMARLDIAICLFNVTFDLHL